MSLATDLMPDVRLCVRPLRSSEISESETTTRTTTVSVRRDRRDLATQEKSDTSASRGGDQHPLEGFELLQALPAAHGDAVQRVAGHHDGHPRLVLEARLEAVQHGPAAGEHDPLLHDVGSEFRGR